MGETRLDERDISLPLLSHPDDPQTAGSRARSDDWTHSSPHGKYSKWVAFPFRRILHALLAVIALVVLGLLAYGSFVGFHAYRKLVFPHRAVHASAATARDGSRVVKPYFTPKGKGGVHEGTLLVKIWFQDQESQIPLPYPNGSNDAYWEYEWRQGRQLALMNSIGETGFVDGSLVGMEGQSDWTEQFSIELPIRDVERTVNSVAHVTLPGRIIHSLVTKSRSLLVATFELLPDPAAVDASVTYEHRSTRPTSLYGPSQPWPLPYSSSDSISPASFNEFFAHSGTGTSLKTREHDYREARSATGMWIPDQTKYATFLSTRTWITMSNEYSIYGVDQYLKAQDALKQFKTLCANGTDALWYDTFQEDCFRTFGRDGHFENLLISEDSADIKQWKYGPFLTTRLSPTAPDDFLELPSEADMKKMNPDEVQDFSFDWSIRYFALSPAKLSLSQSHIVSSGIWGSRPGIWGKMNNDSYSARDQDKEEFTRALLGLTVDPRSRPVSRNIVQFISDGLSYLVIPLILHYWYTRRVSTGISMIPLVAQYTADLIFYIVSCAVNMEYVWILIFVLAIICFVAIILKQLYLLVRPEFRMEHHKSSGLMFPSAVRFRLATVSESRSHKLDLKFDWRLRILMTIVTFCVLRFAPAPPAIVAARKYSDILQGFGGFQHYNPTVLIAIHTLAAIRSSIWLTACLSQISLNQRNKTFAGSYALTAYLQLGALVLSQVTKIFVRWFGRSQVMQPYTVWDVVMLLILGVTVVQAWMLPKVEQLVEETLD